jgi:hypothetical protein
LESAVSVQLAAVPEPTTWVVALVSAATGAVHIAAAALWVDAGAAGLGAAAGEAEEGLEFVAEPDEPPPEPPPQPEITPAPSKSIERTRLVRVASEVIGIIS